MVSASRLKSVKKRDFRYGSDSDLDAPEREVRFASINGHRQRSEARPKSGRPDRGQPMRPIRPLIARYRLKFEWWRLSGKRSLTSRE
jgi:hypothetical protein